MAIWQKLFNKITFKDYPDISTPLNATNLNAMTDAIDGLDDRVVELNSNLEFHKGDSITYSEITNGILSGMGGGGIGFMFTLPKEIGSDVTSVSINGTINWIRTTSGEITLSNQRLEISKFEKNVIFINVYNDNISRLTYYVAMLTNVTFTFN